MEQAAETRAAEVSSANQDETSNLLVSLKDNVIKHNTQDDPAVDSKDNQPTVEPRSDADEIDQKLEKDGESTEDVGESEKMVDGYVMVEPEKFQEEIFQRHRAVLIAQLQARLQIQLEKCNHYQKVLANQDNMILKAKFIAYASSTTTFLETLENQKQNKEWIPTISHEMFKFEGVPFNPEVREKELQLVVRTSNLSKNRTYVVAQFEFAHPNEEHWTRAASRWYHYSKIDPRNICLCSEGKHHQFDKILINDMVQLDEPFSPFTQYNRPISFFVDRGKSKTLKRKFKPVKLTFYEKQCAFKYDNKIGNVQVKIDEINDESTIFMKLPIMNGRKTTDGVAEITIKVREPLVEKSPRPLEEKILIIL